MNSIISYSEKQGDYRDCNITLDVGYKICNHQGMQIRQWLETHIKNQAFLAEVIKKGNFVQKKDIVRAHRIFHGALPNPDEMQKIAIITDGAVTANDFYDIAPKSVEYESKELRP